jgi:hypothetical protein
MRQIISENCLKPSQVRILSLVQNRFRKLINKHLVSEKIWDRTEAVKIMKYRLKKGTPWHKAGEVFTHDATETFLRVNGAVTYYSPHAVYFLEFFEEVQEPKWTDEDMLSFLSDYLMNEIDDPRDSLGYWKEKKLNSEQNAQASVATGSQ